MKLQKRKVHNVTVATTWRRYYFVPEKYYLVFWRQEEMVSIHSDGEVKAKEKSIGESCQVRFGKKEYVGLIASIGNRYRRFVWGEIIFSGSKEEMIAREKAYIDGSYTPFERGKIASS